MPNDVIREPFEPVVVDAGAGAVGPLEREDPGSGSCQGRPLRAEERLDCGRLDGTGNGSWLGPVSGSRRGRPLRAEECLDCGLL